MKLETIMFSVQNGNKKFWLVFVLSTELFCSFARRFIHKLFNRSGDAQHGSLKNAIGTLSKVVHLYT